MSPVAPRRSRHTVAAAAFIGLAVLGLAVIAAACTPDQGPSAPTVAPTLAVARPAVASASAARIASVTRT